MPTRTWLTTPPDQAPTDDSSADDERYVPGPGLPSEPRVPGRHRLAITVLTVAAATVALIATLVLVGAETLSEDPSVPDTTDGPDTTEGTDTSGDEQPEQLELPES